MAEALLGVAFENLLSLLQNEFATISGIKSKVQKLSTTLDLIKAVLEDAEQKQVTDHSIKVWLQQLKDAVYVLDDILDECSIKSRRLSGSSSFKPKNIMFRRDIGNRLKDISRRLDNIAEKSLRTLFQLKHYNDEELDYFPINHSLRVLRTPSFQVSSFGSLIHLSLKTGHSLVELRDLNLGGKLNIVGLNNVGSLSEAKEANLIGKKDLYELCLSWYHTEELTEPPIISVEQVLEVLQPHSNLKRLKISYYEGLFLPSWISILSNLVALELRDCEKCVRLPSFGKLQCLKKLELYRMYNLKYLDDDDDKSHDFTELRIFPSLEVLILENLPNLEGLLKVERGEVFPCISNLKISRCPKLRLPCLPSLKDLDVFVCNSELLKSISSFCGLTTLKLDDGDGITFLPEGMFRNLVCLQTLKVDYFPNLKELPKEPFSLVMEHLIISSCDELDSLPEEIWKDMIGLNDESPKKAVNLNNGDPTNVIPTITNAERVTASPEPQQPQSSEGSHVHVRNIIQTGQLHSSAVEVFMIAGRPYELIENLHKLALHNLQSAKFDNTYCIKDICFCHGLSWQ
ncbi:hypothetical protein P8452_43754 [Trifolium repens]|nr:hypothetical protein P8452_43754 [Trifolium repens]